MPFLELSLPCTEAQQPRYERALEDVGALAVTLVDAHADAPDEQAIFEPGVGEQPLWGELVLTALFPDDTDGLILLGYGDYMAYRSKLDQLVEQGTHFVRWGPVLPDQPGISIGCDNFQGGRLVGEHLAGLGRVRTFCPGRSAFSFSLIEVTSIQDTTKRVRVNRMIRISPVRVIGADGSLTGYGGGLERKRFLLDLEAATLARRAAS